MTPYYLQIIETLVVFGLYLLVGFLSRWAIRSAVNRHQFNAGRERIAYRIIHFIALTVAGAALAGIWGLEGKELFAFLTSVLAVIGVAFVAQWSILSNITSGLILFFNHPLKIGDYIRVLEKEVVAEGRVVDISFFFLHLRSTEGDHFTIPNSVVLQKTIQVVKSENGEES